MKKITLSIVLVLLCTFGFAQTFTGTGTPVDTQNGSGDTAATCGTAFELNLTVDVTGVGILGPSNNILDQVDIDITHTWAGDVNVTLIAPDGTTSAVLTAGNGGSGDDYTGTEFRDDAATSIVDGTAPFTGQFQPQEALSTFDGVDADGTWTLNFCDSVGGDTGTFNSWALTFKSLFQTFDGTGTPVDTQNGSGDTAATCGTAFELNLTVDVTGIGVLGNANILDQVDIDITHTWAGDVNVTLIAPDGTTSAVLTAGNGGSGDDYTGTEFRDDAATSIVDGTAPFTGQFQPQEALSTFIGVDADGTWTLNFCDSVGGDTGTFNSWALTFGPAPSCLAGAGTLTADASQVLLDGTTTISATEDAAPTVPAGFTTLYVLTSGPTLLIEQAAATPSFDVTVANDYTIHTLVYDPNTLDPGSLPPGATGVDVNNLLIQGGGTICGALDVAGAPVSVIDPASLEELLTVDLSVENEVTVVATSGLSVATVSGSDGIGFLLADFFVNAGNQSLAGNTLVSGDLTSAADISDGNPALFRGGAGADVGLNIWSYTDTPTSSFTAGQLAFTGQATWTLTVDQYNAFLTAPVSGLIYFPADSTDDIPGATLIGEYSVLLPLSIDDVNANAFSYYPNPVKNSLTLSAQNNIETVTMFNMLGQEVLRAAPNNIDSELDMSGLQAGTYFVRVTIANTTQTIKVVKQ